LKLNHLHLHVRDRRAAEPFYRKWFGMNIVRSGDSLTFLADDRGFDLALMDDSAPAGMPAWFHFGYRMDSAREVLALHERMSRSNVAIVKPLYEDSELVSFRCADPDGYAIEVYWEAS
jgi:catechol-2,3-dioxygenase